MKLWQSKLSAALASPAFAYVTILLLQLKRMWGIWDFRDLAVGDTPHYFSYGYDWFRHRHVDFAWSPLYTAFYGSFLNFSKDAYVVTGLHRVAIVLLAVLLVLAVLRQMLPHPIAWLTAAWWAFLTINHNTLYEVHLFSLLPILLAWLAIMRCRGPWGRGTGLAVFLAATLLLRNELIVAVAGWAAICIVKERRARRDTRTENKNALPVLLAYAIPIALACGLAGYFYSRSIIKEGQLMAQVDMKHRLNMAQVYAFGYQQRHPEWTGDPWNGYAGLCQRDFGTAKPTFVEMLRQNPHAAAEHLGWNVRLLPAGLQMLLFDVHSGSFSPDYIDFKPSPALARLFSAVVLAILLAGLLLLWKGRRWWWDNWFQSRSAGWAAMGVVAVVAVFVVPTQRPRPSYLFAQGVFLMTAVGTCAFIILATLFRRRPGAERLAGRFMPAVMLILPAVIPSPFALGKPVLARPVQLAYHEIFPFQDSIERANAVLVDDGLVDALGNYLSYGKVTYLGYSVLQERLPGESLAQFLDRKGITFFLVNEACWEQCEEQEPGSIRGLLDNGAATGWWPVAFQNRYSRSLLFRRGPAGPPSAGARPWVPPQVAKGLQPPPAETTHAGLRPISGLGPAEIVDAEFTPLMVHWGLWPATRLAPRDTTGGTFVLHLRGIAACEGQSVTVLLDGSALGTFPWPGITDADMHQAAVPVTLSPGMHSIELRYGKAGPFEEGVLFWEMRLERR